MITVTVLSTVVSILGFRLRRRASLELELIALRHQVSVLRRQRPGRLRLFSTDRLLWVWLYRVWPQVLNAMVLVKPATVVQWHRKGFRTYWRWRSRRPGRPKMSTEIRDLIRRMSLANPLTWGSRCQEVFSAITSLLFWVGAPSSIARFGGAESSGYALTDWSAGRSEGSPPSGHLAMPRPNIR